MDELAKNLSEARRHLEVAWDPDHAALVFVGVERRKRRRVIAAASASTALIALAALAGWVTRARTEAITPEPQPIVHVEAPAKTPVVERRIALVPSEPLVPSEAIAQPLESAAAQPPTHAKQKMKALAARAELEPLDREVEARGTTEDAVAELLDRADEARRSGRAEEAIAVLERVLEEHAGDPRATLASFTIGRLLLETLGRPRDAAEIFARTRALDPRGALAEDALAREVEAWLQAGEEARARVQAAVYRELYPRGSRIRIDLP